MSEQTATALIVAVIALGVLWTFRAIEQPPSRPASVPAAASLSPEMVPLVTGDEPLAVIFTRAGCSACHRIPGIDGADGRVGPPLLMGISGPERLRNPLYRGRAKTVHEYVIESVLEPSLFVVPGYPPNTMPNWYGAKLSALALERIASYLEQQKDERSGSSH